MMLINVPSTKKVTMFIIILLITITGIISLIYNTDINQQSAIKWEKLQAQQASFNAIFIAQQMLTTGDINQECANSDNCPFWGAYPIIRLTNKKGLPNKIWWEKNAYPIKNSFNNAKFIIIKLPNNLYKIIAFAENDSKNYAVINAGYFKKIN